MRPPPRVPEGSRPFRPRGPAAPGRNSESSRRFFLGGYESDVLHSGSPDYRQHPHHFAIGYPRVRLQVHPTGFARGHQRPKGDPEIRIGHWCLINENATVPIDRHHHALLGGKRSGLSARKLNVNPALHDRCRNHEDNQEHQHNVHQGGDVDVGHQRELPTLAAQSSAETRHQTSPSRAMVPISSLAKPSSSPANSRTRLTYRL